MEEDGHKTMETFETLYQNMMPILIWVWRVIFILLFAGIPIRIGVGIWLTDRRIRKAEEEAAKRDPKGWSWSEHH